MIDAAKAAMHGRLANVAMAKMNGAMTEFQAHIADFNWAEAEQARLVAVSHLEAYLDHMKSTYQMLQAGQQPRKPA